MLQCTDLYRTVLWLYFSCSIVFQLCHLIIIYFVYRFYDTIRCRFVGSAYPIELMMEKGRRFQSDEVQIVTVAELAGMNPHIAAV